MYGTFTLTGRLVTPGGEPGAETAHRGRVLVYPNVSVIRDQAGNVVLSGAAEAELDATGAFVLMLPAADPNLIPSEGLGYTLVAPSGADVPRTSFAAPLAGETVDLADLVDAAVVPVGVTPATTQQLDDVEDSVAAVAADVGALQASTSTVETNVTDLQEAAANDEANIAALQQSTADDEATLAALQELTVNGRLSAAQLAAAFAPRIVQYAFKPVDTVRNNTAVLAADPHLVIPVKANGIYLVEGYLAYQATTVADLSVSWQVGGVLPPMRWNPIALAAGATGSASAISRATFTNTVAIAMGGTGTAVDARPQGLVWVGPADGDFKLFWAQSVAEASDAALQAGSWLRLTKVA